jgi:hypothetical protein
MTKKIKYLIAINIVLVGLILTSIWQTNKTEPVTKFTPSTFALTDSASVDRFEIGDLVIEKKSADEWLINNKYTVQPEAILSLFMVMQRIAVKRETSISVKEAIKAKPDTEKIRVSALANGKSLVALDIIQDNNDTYAASVTDAVPELVFVPGYDANIYAYFKAISEDTWRDHRVLVTSFRSLKKLEVNYTADKAESFTIQFVAPFYKVEGINKLDSAALFYYISDYERFSVAVFLKDKFLLDSLTRAVPYCTIKLEDSFQARNNTLRIFQARGKMYGISLATNELVGLEPRSLKRILIKKSNFEKKQ